MIIFDGVEYLTTEEVRDTLHLCRETLYRWARAGKIQSAKVGKRRYYRKDEIARIMREGVSND